ncbi:uncharacterized protein LOC106642402 [Copidosoma floridanum]|uniref:uncharacterized protein LOC106642402 n=1 Tax=Copidosoma floridanum TaxID=29053 RepID=UPI0006C9C3DF|nr:uncharacterized protein LOC106642402 [Copidosoma floridanum]
MKSNSCPEIKRLSKKTLGPLDSLVALGRDNWCEDIIIVFVVSRFDNSTNRKWQKHLGSSDEPPTLARLHEFIAAQIITMETLKSVKRKPTSQDTSKSKPQSSFMHQIATFNDSGSISCFLCGKPHRLFSCPTFQGKPLNEKRQLVNDRQLCLNFLGQHFVKQCKSKFSCSVCHRKHHTLLHKEEAKSSPSKDSTSFDKHAGGPKKAHELPPDQSFCANINLLRSEGLPSEPKVLLATTRIYVRGPDRSQVLVRVLVDQDSQSSLVTRSLCEVLRLKTHSVSISLAGVEDSPLTHVTRRTYINFQPHFDSCVKRDTEALHVPKISSYKPPTSRSLVDISYIQEPQLADPDYHSLDKIDVLLEAFVHAYIIQNSIQRGSLDQPITSASQIGWLLSEPVSFVSKSVPSFKQASHLITAPEEIAVMHISKGSDLDEVMQRFWLVEKPLSKPELKEDDLRCEEQFNLKHSQSPDGHFVVKLPFKGETVATLSLREGSYKTVLSMIRQQRFRNDP